MFEEMIKQGEQVAKFNQNLVSWQMEQIEKTQEQLKAQTEAMMTFTMNSVRIGMDGALSAQQVMLDAFRPGASAFDAATKAATAAK